MRRLLWILSAGFMAWAALVLATGGIQWRIAGVLFRSRDPGRALLLVAVLLLAQAIFFRRPFADDLDRLAVYLRRAAPWLAMALAVVLTTEGVRYGTYTAGGSDVYGYVSQAYGWASGHLPRAYDLQLTLPLPSGDRLQAPLGHRLGQLPHTMVPTYAPGLPLLMALAILTMGTIGPYLIGPVSAGFYLWFTFLLGRRAGGPSAGLIAAVLVATSPVVLSQNIWPMSDLPASALWAAAIVAALGDSRPRAGLSGLCTALALLVRPNLILLALVPAAQIAFSSRGREAIIRALLFGAPIVPVMLTIAALNSTWYGGPTSSGYGSTADLYSFSSVWPNLHRYPVWLWRAQSPWILLIAASLLAVFRPFSGRSAVRLAWALFTLTVLSYLAYFAFEEWWYLRFLLPGLGAFFVLMAVGLIALTSRVPRPWNRVLTFVVVLLIVKHATGYALSAVVFGPLTNVEHRYADVGEFVSRTLPDNAVVFAMQHSGGVRFYGGRVTLRYDFLDADSAAGTPAALERLGLHPYMVIDDWEVPEVQKHFKFPEGVPLPWPYVARMRENGGVTVYDLATVRPDLTPVALEPDLAPLYSAPKTIVIRPR